MRQIFAYIGLGALGCVGTTIGCGFFLALHGVWIYAVYRSWPWSWWWLGIYGGWMAWVNIGESLERDRSEQRDVSTVKLCLGFAGLLTFIGSGIACIYQHSR